MKSPSNFFEGFKTSLFKNYGENPGKMLVHTGVLGWILSSLAQVGAVVFNDKISPEQKIFLIPQEIGDAVANILSFYVITSSVKSFASKLVSTGKLRTPKIEAFLKKNNIRFKPKGVIKADVGDIKFDISKMANFDEIAKDYKPFKNGVDVVASTIGSIISCNLVTPVIRNKYASNVQKKTLERMKKNEENSDIKAPRGISMNDYQKYSSLKYSSGSLKI